MKRLFAVGAMIGLTTGFAFAGSNTCSGVVTVGVEWTTVKGDVDDYAPDGCRVRSSSTIGRRILAVCPDGSTCSISIPLNRRSPIITEILYVTREAGELRRTPRAGSSQSSAREKSAIAAIGEEARIRPQEPVIIKPPEDGAGDPCGTGIVRGLDPRGDGFLAVKAGPGLRYKRIDKLHNGEEVYLCGYLGDWHAIVYSKTAQYCNVSGGLAKVHYPYTGPCRSGWAHKRWIEAVAG